MQNFLFEQVLENISDFEEKSTKIFIDSTRQDLANFLRKKNFIFADRTIQVTIPLKNFVGYLWKFRKKIIAYMKLQKNLL